MWISLFSKESLRSETYKFMALNPGLRELCLLFLSGPR